MSPKEKLKELIGKIGSQTALEKRSGIAQGLISNYINEGSKIGGLPCLYFAAIDDDREYWLTAADRAPGPVSSMQRELLRKALSMENPEIDPAFFAGIVRLLQSKDRDDQEAIRHLKEYLASTGL